MVKCKKWILAKKFDGFPKESDFKVVEEELPPIQNGEFLTEAIFASVDPYMMAFAARLPLGITMIGTQVAKVIDSKNPKFPVGKNVVGDYGWCTHHISDGTPKNYLIPETVLPDFGNLPVSLGLGILGMPGNTAYFGFLEICQPKKGETVVVSGAAGAVGSTVGQIAKIKGCKVIGIAGSDEKGKWLTDELNFDHFINYKTANISEALKEVAPNGVDCYFDNVGGKISSTVLNQMNHFGRIAVCGAISTYSEKELQVPVFQDTMISKQLKMEGLIVTRWSDRWKEGILANLKWVKEGKLKYKETVTEGVDNMCKALVDMLQGGNTGKAIVKV